MRNLDFVRTVSISNRSNRNRLLGIIAGVMVGVSLALLLLAASNSFPTRNLRSTWAENSGSSYDFDPSNAQVEADQMLVSATIDHYAGNKINVLFFHAQPETTATIPGVPQLPKEGTFLVSPALAEHVRTAGAGELSERWGTLAGELPTNALRGPDSLVALVSTDLETVLNTPGTDSPILVRELVGKDFSSTAYRIVAMIGAVAVLVPALLLIGIVTELGAVQRQQRFSTLRLIGATPGQVAAVSALETGVTSLVGSLLGIGLYLAVVPLAAQIPIEGSRFYPGDLILAPLPIALTVIGVVTLSTGWAWLKARRLGQNPLVHARRRNEKRPRWWSIVPLVIGVAAFAAPAVAKQFDQESTLLSVYSGELLLVGFLGTAFGLLWAGPWLTALVARATSGLAGSPALVVGANRVAHHPRATFRSVAGMVIAVFTVTFFSVGITSAASEFKGDSGPGALPAGALVSRVYETPEAIAAATTAVRGVEGVTDAFSLHPSYLESHPRGSYSTLLATDAVKLGLDVPTGAEWVAVNEGWITGYEEAEVIESAQPVKGPDSLTELVVLTDGKTASVERARTTLLLRQLNFYSSPRTPADTRSWYNDAPEIEFSILASIGILIAAAISTVALGVSTYAAFVDRLRVFGLLRLSGMPRRVLGRITAWEAALPVATVFLLSVGLGAFSAWALVTGVSQRKVGVPGPMFLVTLAACLALMVAAVAATSRAAAKADTGGITRFE